MMVTEPRAPEFDPPGEPGLCRHCRRPVVNTVLGWMHADTHGTPVTWLCADLMTLAEPDFLAATKAPPGAETLPGPEAAPKPKRRPTPIPRRTDVGRAESSRRPAPPAEWPPLPDKPWWEDRP